MDYNENSNEWCSQNKYFKKCSFVNDTENEKKCCKTCKKTTKYAIKKKDRCKLEKNVCCRQSCCRPGSTKNDGGKRVMFEWWNWDAGWF